MATSEPQDCPWQERIRQVAASGIPAWNGPGRVLRVKLGYNPNSSSVGSVVTVLMWTTVFSSVVLNAMAAVVVSEWKRQSAGALPSNPDDAP